jgi:hypothetical protein
VDVGKRSDRAKSRNPSGSVGGWSAPCAAVGPTQHPSAGHPTSIRGGGQPGNVAAVKHGHVGMGPDPGADMCLACSSSQLPPWIWKVPSRLYALVGPGLPRTQGRQVSCAGHASGGQLMAPLQSRRIAARSRSLLRAAERSEGRPQSRTAPGLRALAIVLMRPHRRCRAGHPRPRSAGGGPG